MHTIWNLWDSTDLDDDDCCVGWDDLYVDDGGGDDSEDIDDDEDGSGDYKSEDDVDNCGWVWARLTMMTTVLVVCSVEDIWRMLTVKMMWILMMTVVVVVL
jgi:hypothetical protein